MSSRVETAPAKIEIADWIITLFLFGVMAAAYWMTLGWPAHTAFFPRLLSGSSLVLIAIKLASMAYASFATKPLAARPAPAAPAPVKKEDGEIELVVSDVDEDQGNEEEAHDVFSSADGRTWAATIGWIALFFVGMYLFGLLVILPIFTVAYLRIVAKSSWLTCVLYVLGTTGVMYAMFVMFLHLPLPQGIFPIIGD